MANVSILIQAKDQASKTLDNVSDSIERTGKSAEASSPRLKGMQDNLGSLVAVSALATTALFGITKGIEDSINAANRYQSAMLGLHSISNAFGQDAGKAEQAAKDLAKDGLMTVGEAAGGLKNLLASGFGLDQAITLMTRFKDTAAFNRQAALGYGEAIVTATEGIKNGNSILVDNAGITKNLSIILKEAGFAETDLMKATSDANVRQALFNGLLKESQPMLGDAARLAETAAGKQAMMSAQTQILYQKIGLSLQPALLALLQAVTPIITTVSDWISKNPELSAGIIVVTTGLVGLTAAIGVVSTAISILGPAFTTFKVISLASMGAVQTGFAALSAVVASPIVMPAIAVGAALAAIAAVMVAYQQMRSAVEEATAAKQNFYSENARIAGDLQRIINDGVSSPEAKARAKKAYDAVIANGNYVANHAIGTSYASGGRTLVGENGPEIVNLPRGSEVIPAYRTRGDAAQGTGTTNNYLTGTFNFQTAESVQEFFSQLDKTQRLARMGLAS